MNGSCSQFRARLEAALAARPPDPVRAGALGELGWHEHLLSCGECRQLLASEEALEEVLATLPAPHLSPSLARRVLLRLRAGREELAASDSALESLLDAAGSAPAPAGLAGRVLGRLAPHRDDALERLLERLPEPQVQGDLAARVLARLRLQRERTAPVRRRVLAYASLRVAAVALAILGAAWWILREQRPGSLPAPVAIDETPRPGSSDIDEAPPELLASLDMFESWDALRDDELDLLLRSWNALGETLVELEAPPFAGEEEHPRAPATAPPKEG